MLGGKGLQKANLSVGETIFKKARPYIHDSLSREWNIFLIGKDLKGKNSMRNKIYSSLTNSPGKDIAISFPENLFEEQLLQRTLNLLSLENLLAKSVDAIVLCAESPGSLAELGAFSNHGLLNNKLIVYLDQKYSRDKSFINLGPVKYLKQKTNSKVNYIPFNMPFSRNDSIKLRNNIRTLKKTKSLLITIVF